MDNGTKTDLQLLSLTSLKEAKKEFEKEFVRQKLSQYNNNISKTAKEIGVDRSYLQKKIKQITP